MLVLDCYLDDRGGAGNVVPRVGDCTVLRPAHEALPREVDAEALVITGSAASVLEPPPWLGALEALVADALQRDVPVLGLCFGHQVLARALWGPDAVRRSARPELGWETVRRTGDDDLFAGVPESFRCFVSHDDEVDPARIGPDGVVLAHTSHCAVHAFRAGDRPLWGVQFHAEMGWAESEALVRARAERKGLDPEEVLAARVDTEAIVDAIFRNFTERASGRR